MGEELFDGFVVHFNCVPFSGGYLDGKIIWDQVKKLPEGQTRKQVQQRVIVLLLDVLNALLPDGQSWASYSSFGTEAREWSAANVGELRAVTKNTRIHTLCCHISSFTQSSPLHVPTESDCKNLTGLGRNINPNAADVGQQIWDKKGSAWDAAHAAQLEGCALGGKQHDDCAMGLLLL